MLRALLLTVAITLLGSFLCLCRAQIALTPYYTISSGASGLCVAIADVNGDGRNDVVMASDYNFSANSYKLYVYTQQASGLLNTTPAVYSYTPANNLNVRAMVV